MTWTLANWFSWFLTPLEQIIWYYQGCTACWKCKAFADPSFVNKKGVCGYCQKPTGTVQRTVGVTKRRDSRNSKIGSGQNEQN